jgi:hypothetical protein
MEVGVAINRYTLAPPSILRRCLCAGGGRGRGGRFPSGHLLTSSRHLVIAFIRSLVIRSRPHPITSITSIIHARCGPHA